MPAFRMTHQQEYAFVSGKGFKKLRSRYKFHLSPDTDRRKNRRRAKYPNDVSDDKT